MLKSVRRDRNGSILHRAILLIAQYLQEFYEPMPTITSEKGIVSSATSWMICNEFETSFKKKKTNGVRMPLVLFVKSVVAHAF